MEKEGERRKKSHTRFAIRNQRDWLSYSHWRKIIQSHVADVFEQYILSGKNAGKSFDQSQRQQRIYSRFSSWTSANAVCSPARWHKQIFCISKCWLKFTLILIHSLTQTHKQASDQIRMEGKKIEVEHTNCCLPKCNTYSIGLIFAKSTENAQNNNKKIQNTMNKYDHYQLISRFSQCLRVRELSNSFALPWRTSCRFGSLSLFSSSSSSSSIVRSLFSCHSVFMSARAFGKTKNRHLLLPAYILHSSFGCFSVFFFVSASCLWNQNNKIPKQIPSTITVAIL